ncbi:MAG: Wzz/FepE/Etk N-terminal domain-containing protein, partial [Bacteroidia bacterium]|nr:Wzz/FepE/Etk N-terminal domain-containing protein [Bacteroidia bacterium]
MNDSGLGFGLQEEWIKIWKRKFWILGSMVVAILLVLIYCWIVKPEYKSKASFIPPDYGSVKALDFKEHSKGIEVGEDIDVERSQALLTSDNVFQHISKKFNLVNHYEIDDTLPEIRDKKLYSRFQNNIEVKITEYSTIEITVYDTDPVLSAAIANEYLIYADSFLESMCNRKAALQALVQSIEELNRQKRSLLDSIGEIRAKYGLYSVENLSEELSRVVVLSMKKYPEFPKYYEWLESSAKRIEFLEKNLARMEDELARRKENLVVMPHLINITEKAVPPTYKSRPQPLLYSIVAALLTAFLCIFY